MAKSKVDEVTLDFTDTESRGGKKGRGARPHYPEGDYAVKIKKTEKVKSGEDKPGIRVDMVIAWPTKYKGKAISDTLWLTEKAVWRVRTLMEAAKIKVPSKKVKVNPADWVGKALAITLEDDEYKDRVYSSVTDFFMLSELDMSDSDEEEDDDADGDDEDDDTDEDDEDDDLEGVDLDDL